MHIPWLPYLIFLDPTIGLHPDFSTEHCIAFKSDVYASYCNAVYSTDVPSDDEIEEIKHFFTPFNWVVASDDSETIHKLMKHGFQKVSTFPVMSKALDSPIICEQRSDLHIVQVSSQEEFSELIRILSDSFNYSFEHVDAFVLLIKSRVYPDRFKLYLAYYNTVPVAMLMAVQHSDITAIHCVGTLEAYRKKGISSALMNRVLLDAQQVGSRMAILSASSLAQSMYLKLGFQIDCYCDSYALA